MLGLFTDTDEDSDTSDVEMLDADGNKEAKPIAWAYVGSHNFTPSAWGNVSGSSFNPVINVRSNCPHLLFCSMLLHTLCHFSSCRSGITSWE